MREPELQIEARESGNKSELYISYHIWIVLFLPITPLVERVSMVTAGSAQIGCIRLSPLNCGFAAEIANQALRSAGEEEEIVWIYFD